MKALFLAICIAVALLFAAPAQAEPCIQSVWMNGETTFVVAECDGRASADPGSARDEPVIIIEDSRVEMERIEQMERMEQQRRLIEERKRAMAQRGRS